MVQQVLESQRLVRALVLALVQELVPASGLELAQVQEASRQTRLAPRQTWLAQLADQLVPVASSYLRLLLQREILQALHRTRSG